MVYQVLNSNGSLVERYEVFEGTTKLAIDITKEVQHNLNWDDVSLED